MRKPTKENSLGAKFPKLIESWHPTKNGSLTPFDVFPKSGRKAWWLCDHGHEWEARIAGRSNGKGCPYCSGHKLGKTNCLAAKFPKVAKDWHPIKNGDLTPFDVMQKTDLRVWWKCSKGHEWEATVSSRANGTSCPYCAGQKATKENNFAKKFPHLVSEWHPVKNGELTPEKILPKSDKEIWWLCKNGHEWKTQLKKRARGDGCPFCSGHKPSEINNLSCLFPEIAKEWHPTKNGKLSPLHVTPKSDKKVWWKCKKGHEWQAQVKNRSNGNNCPYCNNRLADQNNNFAVLYPEIAKEWHPTKNNELSPNSFLSQSNIKVWWKCNYGHEWKASISSRTNGSNCPKCFSQTSSLELRVYCELKKLLENVTWQSKIKGMECDVYLGNYKIAIEFDGFPWHRGYEKRDKKKNSVLTHAGITIIRLRDSRLKKISENDLFYKKNEDEILIISRLFSSLLNHNMLSVPDTTVVKKYLRKNKLQNVEEYKKIFAYLPSPPKNESLQHLNPEVINIWEYEKNSPLTPRHFRPGSNKKVWWQCEKGHKWKSRISHISSGHGCPYCAGNLATKTNNLSITHPELVKEWNFAKNKGISPNQAKYGSNSKVWWICEYGHEWVSAINIRAKGSGCPVCKSLMVRFPDIAKEWHPIKNGSLEPDEIGGRSGKKVWWLCKNGHEWQAAINNRTARKGTNCPICRSLKDPN
ncbi:MAG: hypothetical protein K9N10_12920 [Deltaproteobacteria bacterium]|nr:hypothetical protein [Deltaproteobacteria bacterium]